MDLNDTTMSDWLKDQTQKITPIKQPTTIYPFPCDFKCCDASNKISLSKNNMIQKCLHCNTLLSLGG